MVNWFETREKRGFFGEYLTDNHLVSRYFSLLKKCVLNDVHFDEDSNCRQFAEKKVAEGDDYFWYWLKSEGLAVFENNNECLAGFVSDSKKAEDFFFYEIMMLEMISPEDDYYYRMDSIIDRINRYRLVMNNCSKEIFVKEFSYAFAEANGNKGYMQQERDYLLGSSFFHAIFLFVLISINEFSLKKFMLRNNLLILRSAVI